MPRLWWRPGRISLLCRTPFGVAMSLHMLLLCEPGARERTEDEYRTLLEESGFEMVKVVRLNAPRDLLIARKP